MSSGNDEGLRAVAAAQTFGADAQVDERDCPLLAVLDQVASYPKRLANLQAQFALRGFSLNPLEADSFVVSKWGLYRVLPGLTAAEEMLVQIGGING
jgi:hypothetical protein